LKLTGSRNKAGVARPMTPTSDGGGPERKEFIDGGRGDERLQRSAQLLGVPQQGGPSPVQRERVIKLTRRVKTERGKRPAAIDIQSFRFKGGDTKRTTRFRGGK